MMREKGPGGGDSRRTNAFLLLPLGLLILVGSCSSTAINRGNEDGFNQVVENFHSALRWGEYQTASTYVGPTMQEDFWRTADTLQQRVNILEYQVKRSTYDPTSRSGTVVVYVRYYANGNPQLLTRTISERWSFNDKDKMWRLVSHELSVLEN